MDAGVGFVSSRLRVLAMLSASSRLAARRQVATCSHMGSRLIRLRRVAVWLQSPAPPMPYLPDLSDRVWFALHCLPRDENGEPPTYRKLERECQLSNGLLSKMALGQRSHQWSTTVRACSAALRVSEAWLQYGGGGGPTPTGVVPPCPNMRWLRHCELSGWIDAVTIARRLERAPLGAR
jgi:hypothetical protein